MTHDSTPPNTRSNGRSLDGIADPSDLLRQLSDLFCLPLGCRRNACRRTERCHGGEGPPCFHEDRKFFAEAMQAGLRETRRFWKRQRALAAEAAPSMPSASEPAPRLDD
jgi:hypothetical protein